MEEAERTMKVWNRKWRGFILVVAFVLFAGNALHPVVSKAAETENNAGISEIKKANPSKVNKNTNTSGNTEGADSTEGTGDTEDGSTNPGETQSPENPGAPKDPGTTEDPGSSGNPEDPKTEDTKDPATPTNPDTDNTQNPGTSGDGQTPGGSQGGQNPGTTENPDGTTGGNENTGGTTNPDENTGGDGDNSGGNGSGNGDNSSGDGTGDGNNSGGNGSGDGDNSGGDGTGDGNNSGGNGTGDGDNSGGNGSGDGDNSGGDGTGDGDNSGGNGSGDGTGGTENTEGNIQIGGDKFSTMKEAWAAAASGAVIELSGPVTTRISSSASTDAVIKSEKDITLDLNGYTWTFQTTSTSRSSSGAPDLIEVSNGTLTVKDSGSGGRIVYSGSGNYTGACLYAAGGKIKIESGTLSSNVSAPVYIGGGDVEITGGTFQNTKSGNAITMNSGRLRMSGGEVASGSLTVEKKDADVALTGGTFAQIKTSDGAVKDVLGSGYSYRKSSTGGTGAWITDLNQLEASAIANVQVDSKPIGSVSLTAASGGTNVSSGETVSFSYAGDKKYDLTAQVSGTSGSSASIQWACSYNDGERKTLANASGTSYSFSNNSPAGKYSYYAGATVNDYTEWSPAFTITITPLDNGAIENKSGAAGFPTQYTYGDPINQPADGSQYFNLINGPGADVKLSWNYTWYKNSVDESNKVTPTDAGNYILKVDASDAPNYTASGTIPVTISPRTITPKVEGTTTKVYDGTAEVKDAKIVLEGLLASDSGRVAAQASSFAYNSANASAASQIVATDIKLTGEGASNYTLSSTQASIPGTITKAKLLLKISVEPSTQKVNRPVSVSVTASYSDSTPMDNDGLKAENILLTVSGRNDTEEAHSLAMEAAPGQYGVYRTSYTTAVKGDKTFEAVIVGNDNYEVSNAASDNSLTMMDKTATTMTLTAGKQEGITYGDSVKFTAAVSRADEDDTDAFTGNVQFYVDSVESGNKVGSVQPVTSSGEKVSVTVDHKKLTAGEHKILAVFTANSSFEDATAEVAVSVEKKQLTWDVSGLSASKSAGTAGEVTVYGELKLEGLLEDDEVTVKQPDVIKTKGLKSAEAGSFKVTVVPGEGEWEFDPKDPKNYALPEEEPQITAKVNGLKELPNPPEAVDGKTFKLVMEEGISSVPEGLRNTSFDTPVKIEQELKRVLTESGVYKEENTAVYDVVLQVSTDEGATWQVADYTNFPAGGLKVTMPYPSGTGRYTNNFAAAHMFSTSYFGKTSGNVELPAIRKTDNGMEFTVTGLSPIALAWSDPADGGVNPGRGGGSSGGIQIGGAATGDGSPILLYAGLAGASALVLMVFVVVRSRSKKKKRR